MKSWSPEDQPREKLMRKGAETLTNVELLAILINNGNRTNTALEIGMQLMRNVNNNLHQLSNLSVAELLNFKINGLGKSKAVAIAAAIELGVRRNMSVNKKYTITQSSDVAAYLQAELGHKQLESFVVVYLNRANKIIQQETIREGGITGTVADPRIILKKA